MPVLTLEELACFYPWVLNQLHDDAWLYMFFKEIWTDKKLADSWQFPPVEPYPRDTDFAQFKILYEQRAYRLWTRDLFNTEYDAIKHEVVTKLHLEHAYLSNTVLEIYLSLYKVDRQMLPRSRRYLYKLHKG